MNSSTVLRYDKSEKPYDDQRIVALYQDGPDLEIIVGDYSEEIDAVDIGFWRQCRCDFDNVIAWDGMIQVTEVLRNE